MVTKDYSKSRMRENRTYGSVRGGQSNLIPSTRLIAFQAEGCGIALSGDEHEVSVTGLALWVIWHDTHAGDWLTAFTTKGGNCGMVHEIYDSLFFLSILLVSP